MKNLLIAIAVAAVCLPADAAPKPKPAATPPASAPAAAGAPVAPLAEKSTRESTLEAFFGTVRTSAQERGIALAIDYGEKLALQANKAFTRRAVDISGSHPTFFKMTPDFHLKTGDKDAFDGVVAKLKANWVILPPFKDVEVPGASVRISMPDPEGWFHVITLAGGLESDGSFKTINGLIEAGWEPEVIPAIGGWQVYTGLYLQGGYKFARDDRNDTGNGDQAAGDKDQSAEKENDILGRFKATLDIKSPEWNIGISDAKLRLIGGATVWYDFVNGEVYHSVKGVARFSLSERQHFDLKYEHGSGAPNFNRGDQFSAGLTILF
jgi:hypothetical protein